MTEDTSCTRCEDGCEACDARFVVVDNDEPSLEDYPGPGPDKNLQQYDEFGAPIRPPVKVRDGVRDTRAR